MGPLTPPNYDDYLLKIVGKSIFIFVLIIFEFQLFTAPNHWIFLNAADLIVHEIGHWVFAFAGQFIYLLGGSLFQILVPIFALIYFKLTNQFFACGFCLFWLGDNLVYVGNYIWDARSMALQLVGGDIHDWNWLLGHMSLLPQDHIIGGIVMGTGFLIGILGILFCVLLVSIEALEKYKLIEN